MNLVKDKECKVYIGNLRKLRMVNEYSQKQLAKIIGKTTATYSKKELGVLSFSVEELEKLAKFYEVSLDELLTKEMNLKLDNTAK